MEMLIWIFASIIIGIIIGGGLFCYDVFETLVDELQKQKPYVEWTRKAVRRFIWNEIKEQMKKQWLKNTIDENTNFFSIFV